MSTQTKNVGVIGGGISGLCAGYALQKEGIEFTLYEKNPGPGGVIRSIAQDGWLVELGPNTLMARSQRLRNLIDELELNDQVVRTGRNAKKRFIVKNGTPTPLPSSLMEFLRTDLLSAKAKMGLFKEPFISKKQENESVASFFARRLGQEVADYLVNPFIAGIYAGDPRRLSMKHTFTSVYKLEQEHGSLLKGALKSSLKRKNSAASSSSRELISFKKGLGQLTDTLYKRLEPALRLESKVSAITKTAAGWSLEIHGQAGLQHHDALIFTAPLHRLPDIQFDLELRSLLGDLSELRYAPIATVALGFEQEQADHPLDGFGMLVPEAENRNILGCLFSSSLFENRAPEAHLLLTSFVGGERSPELVEKTDEEIRELVLEDLQSLLGITGKPKFEYLHKWKQAIPQYELGHQSFLDGIKKMEQVNAGLFFSGNFRDEVSLPGCIELAYETAGRVASFLES